MNQRSQQRLIFLICKTGTIYRPHLALVKLNRMVQAQHVGQSWRMLPGSPPTCHPCSNFFLPLGPWVYLPGSGVLRKSWESDVCDLWDLFSASLGDALFSSRGDKYSVSGWLSSSCWKTGTISGQGLYEGFQATSVAHCPPTIHRKTGAGRVWPDPVQWLDFFQGWALCSALLEAPGWLPNRLALRLWNEL